MKKKGLTEAQTKAAAKMYRVAVSLGKKMKGTRSMQTGRRIPSDITQN